MTKPRKVLPFPRRLLRPSAAGRELLGSKRQSVEVSEEVLEVMRGVSHEAFAFYFRLAFRCDAAGVVNGATYDNLRSAVVEGQPPLMSRSNVRARLVELDAAGLIELDRGTPAKADLVLGIVMPHQSDDVAA